MSIGLLFLGGFVSFSVFRCADMTSPVSLKAAAAGLATALGGTPIAFIRDMQQYWAAYPVGLVWGLLLLRLTILRPALLEGGNSERDKKARLLAACEFTVIAALSAAAICLSPQIAQCCCCGIGACCSE